MHLVMILVFYGKALLSLHYSLLITMYSTYAIHLLVVRVNRLVVLRGEVEGNEGGCSERLSVAECIDTLAKLRAGILRLGIPGLTVV